MPNLLTLLLTLGFFVGLNAQKPHGPTMKMDCASCHTSAGWEISASYWQNVKPTSPHKKTTPEEVVPFHHNQTGFELKGRHTTVDCRACHETLVFSEPTKSDCNACHTDMHQQTVGNDCARCHTSFNWMVDNVTALHYENGFPLTGVHQIVSCAECHQSASDMQFNRLGNECFSCHRTDYETTSQPNHVASGFSTDCATCHELSPGWLFNHNSTGFALGGAHASLECAACHTNGYTGVATQCVACHLEDYNQTTNPNHANSGFSTDCTTCHTTDSGWTPATFDHDNAFFPIYSGKHKNEWDQCSECHTTPGNYKEFSCIQCHEHSNASSLANEHDDVSGYQHVSSACYSCHPKGN